MSDINDTLKERGKRYGNFARHAFLAQSLKRVMHNARSWNELEPDVQEALDMIQHKIARILNGDAAYTDSYHDIAGYATLVEKRLQGEYL